MANPRYYNCKNVSGSVLTDLEGNHNASIAGSPLPVQKNDYLKFTGSFNTGAGYYGRARATAPIFSVSDDFTVFIRYKSTAEQSGSTITGYVFSDADNGTNGYSMSFIYQSLSSTGATYVKTFAKDTTGKRKYGNACDNLSDIGKWKTVAQRLIGSTKTMESYDNAVPVGYATNEAFAVGASLWQAGNYLTLGAMYNSVGGNYVGDWEGDLSHLIIKDYAMEQGQISNLNSHLKGWY